MGRALLVLVALAATLAAAGGELAITGPTLHQFEDGPPIYTGHRYIPGETVFLSFQVQGFRFVEKEERRHLRLSYRIDAVDSQDVRLVPTQNGEVDTTLSPQDKNWLPKIRWRFVIPPQALPGAYRILASVKDEIGGGQAALEVPFAVEGREVAPSDTLVVRNFRFLRREQDVHPLPTPAYRPGDTLWAKFDITGFRMGEHNRIWVEYGISILNASGAVLYSQPEGAVERDAPFYPKRYVPGTVSLNIRPGTPAGDYVLMLSAQDRVGGQTAESRHPFRIE